MDDKLAFRNTQPSPNGPAPMHANHNIGVSQQRLEPVPATVGFKSGAIGVGGTAARGALEMRHELCLPVINASSA